MTQVNWERYSGEQVEEFVSALLLLRNPRGNRITPSQGDRGVDVQIPVQSKGCEFYQIKRFSSSLTGAQKSQVKKSWSTFLKETAPHCSVVSWNVVMPYDPTNQNLEWLKSLTQGSGIEVNWIGRTQLDSWAAENPQLVDYYFGDGRNRTEELLEAALLLGQDSTSSVGLSGDSKIDLLLKKAESIQKLLNDVDPFYRYEYEVRQGSLDEIHEALMCKSREGEIFASITSIGDAGNNIILHVIARCAASTDLRPALMEISFRMDPGSAEYADLQRFLQFGLPAQRIPATITSYDGPPGGPPVGAGMITMFDVDYDDKALPPLELRLIARDNQANAVINVKKIRHGVGVDGKGAYLSMSDEADVFTVQILMSSRTELEDLSIIRESLAGRRPHEVISALQFLEKFVDGGQMELRVRGGGPILIQIDVKSPEGRHVAERYRLFREFVESLLEIQKNVITPLEIPVAEMCSDSDVSNIIRCARLLRGERLKYTWDHLELTVADPENKNVLEGRIRRGHFFGEGVL